MITRIKTSFVSFNRGYCRFIFKENVLGVCDLRSDVCFQWQLPWLQHPQCTYNRFKKKKGHCLEMKVLWWSSQAWFGAYCWLLPLEVWVPLSCSQWFQKFFWHCASSASWTGSFPLSSSCLWASPKAVFLALVSVYSGMYCHKPLGHRHLDC